MSLRRLGLICFLTLVSLTSAWAQQQRRVVVSRPGDELELRRRALQLRICVDRLLDARTALKEATVLVPELRPSQVYYTQQVGQYWIRLDPDRARKEVQGMVELLRVRASEDPALYQQITSAAIQLVQSQQQLDPEKRWAPELPSDWPEPPTSSSAGLAQWLDQAQQTMVQNQFQQLINRDPVAAYEKLADAELDNGNLGLRSNLLSHLVNRGEGAMALELAAQTLALLQETQVNANQVYQLSNLATQLAALDSDRFEQALDLFLDRISILDEAQNGGRGRHQTEGMELTQSEQQYLNFLRGLGNRPQAMFEALDRHPELAAKITAAGGIDEVFAGRRNYRQQLQHDPYQRLQMELQQADVDTLLDRVGRSDDARELMMLAQSAQRFCRRPDDAERVIDAAVDGLDALEVPRRAGVALQLVSTSVRCLAGVPETLESEARLVIDEMREMEGERYAVNRPYRGQLASDRLEIALITAEAVYEFPSVSAEIALLDSVDLQFAAWMQVLQQLVR